MYATTQTDAQCLLPSAFAVWHTCDPSTHSFVALLLFSVSMLFLIRYDSFFFRLDICSITLPGPSLTVYSGLSRLGSTTEAIGFFPSVVCESQYRQCRCGSSSTSSTSSTCNAGRYDWLDRGADRVAVEVVDSTTVGSSTAREAANVKSKA